MRILIDADGCPVVDICVRLAKLTGTECIILCDTSHVFEKPGARTVTVSKGADSVDFALVNLAQKGDIVVTQDYGLAAMAMARSAIPVNQDGMVYDNGNIDGLLMQRHINKKNRQRGIRSAPIPKRTEAQNLKFEQKLKELLR